MKKIQINQIFLNYPFSNYGTSDLIKVLQNTKSGVDIIVITDTNNLFFLRHILTSGANAFISMHTSSKEIELCINTVNLGRRYISKDIEESLESSNNIFSSVHFTTKELQVLQFIAKGYTINETAAALCLSKHTIVAHRRKIMTKSGLNTATGLVKFAFDAGLVN